MQPIRGRLPNVRKLIPVARQRKKDMDVKQLIHAVCKDSIVMKCLERFIFQIVEEIQESTIAPLEKENAKLKAIAGNLHEYEHIRQENVVMRQQLKQLTSPSHTDGFATSGFQNQLAIEPEDEQLEVETGDFFVTAGPDSQSAALRNDGRPQQRIANDMQCSPVSAKTMQDMAFQRTNPM